MYGFFTTFVLLPMSLTIVLILLGSGLLVGFINTLAGGGSAISLTIFMALGLPVQVANGTNRVAILMQNLSSTATFTRKRMIDWREGLRLGVPTIAGTILGAQIAATISAAVFQVCLAVVMVLVLIFTVFGGKLHKRPGGEVRRIGLLHYIAFAAVGVYSGYIFVGTGYIILMCTMGLLGMNIVRSNVLKNFVILLAIPFSLAVFVWNGDVSWGFGLVHGVGNMIGAFLASHYAIGWGTRFLRWFVVVVVLFCLADVVGLISIREAVLGLIG